jgi:CheY-like chemotaxis protein
MSTAPPQVLVYSSNALHRAEVVRALGPRPRHDLPVIAVTEVATAETVVKLVQEGPVALVILDGEAAPVGGLGLARRLRDETRHCPPLLVITARAADDWLARWSLADAAVSHPLDPFTLAEVAAELLAPTG